MSYHSVPLPASLTTNTAPWTLIHKTVYSTLIWQTASLFLGQFQKQTRLQMVCSATGTQTLRQYFLVSQCHMVHTCICSIIYAHKETKLIIHQTELRVVYLHRLSPGMNNKHKKYRQTNIHPSMWSMTFIVPICITFCNHIVNFSRYYLYQILSKSDKICTK